jgi:ribosome-binding factor A
MESKRPERVADLLRQEIADILLRRVKDPRISVITITGVQVSRDLQNATVFFCLTGTSDPAVLESALEGLSKAKSFMRQELGKRLRLRYVPQLIFRYDSSLDYGAKIERILKELQDHEPSTD